MYNRIKTLHAVPVALLLLAVIAVQCGCAASLSILRKAIVSAAEFQSQAGLLLVDFDQRWREDFIQRLIQSQSAEEVQGLIKEEQAYQKKRARAFNAMLALDMAIRAANASAELAKPMSSADVAAALKDLYDALTDLGIAIGKPSVVSHQEKPSGGLQPVKEWGV